MWLRWPDPGSLPGPRDVDPGLSGLNPEQCPASRGAAPASPTRGEWVTLRQKDWEETAGHLGKMSPTGISFTQEHATGTYHRNTNSQGEGI